MHIPECSGGIILYDFFVTTSSNVAMRVEVALDPKTLHVGSDSRIAFLHRVDCIVAIRQLSRRAGLSSCFGFKSDDEYDLVDCQGVVN